MVKASRHSSRIKMKASFWRPSRRILIPVAVVVALGIGVLSTSQALAAPYKWNINTCKAHEIYISNTKYTTHTCVRRVQRVMDGFVKTRDCTYKGNPLTHVDVDGIWGPKTGAAVRCFQQYENIPAPSPAVVTAKTYTHILIPYPNCTKYAPLKVCYNEG